MIIAGKFEGDNDTQVMEIQHDLYMKMCGQLFVEARKVFQFAERVLESDSVPGTLVAQDDSFDHRVLQDAHDILAAAFRFEMKERLMPELSFTFQAKTDEERIGILWQKFLKEQVEVLMRNPEIVRNTVYTVAYQNGSVGYEAEDKLYRLLIENYPDIPWTTIAKR